MSEADEGSQQTKRRGIARACDQCRHGKLRCDGASPRCSKCLETKKACSYGAAAKRRGLKTGYVRALECLWGLALQKIEGCEAAVESLLNRSSILDFRARDQHGDSTIGAESLLASWKSSKIPEMINQLLVSTEDSEEEANAVPNAIIRRTDEHDPIISWTSHVPQHDEQASHLPPTSPNSAEKYFAPVSQPARREDGIYMTTGTGDTSAAVGQPALSPPLKLPAGSRRLLDRYFTYTHSWLPIVERHVVFQTLYTYPQEGSIITRQSSDSGKHAVLWAIFACASAELPQTETNPVQLAGSTQMSELMYSCARSLIPWESEHEYSLGHVQALTILALYRWIVHDYRASWFAISHAIAIALAIDLDQIATAWQSERCPADRVWLGCFVMESLLAIRLRRVPSLRSQDVDPYLPIDESGPEEWEPLQPYCAHSEALQYQDAELNLPMHTLSTFNHLVRLLSVANSFLRLPSGTPGTEQLTRLQAWTNGLPTHCKQLGFHSGLSSSIQIPVPNIVNLGFVYMCLEIQLCIDSPSDLKTLSEYADLINHICHSGGSQTLPPSWELLAIAVSNTQDIQIRPREASLRQLQKDLSRFGLGGSNMRLKMTTNQHENASPPAIIDIPNGGREINRLDPTILATDTRPGQTGTASNGRLALIQQVDTAAGQIDFPNTETLPAMAEDDPFLDYFELFDDPEMQDQSHFMKALGFNS